MKVSGPGRIQSGSVKKSTGKSKTDGAAFAKELTASETADEVSQVSATAPVAPVNALIGLQEVPDATDGRSKGLKRANEMLDMLEEVRKGLLLGAIPVSRLRLLADMARGKKNQPQFDPRLKEILEDIELRAEVELAKLGY